MKLLINKKAFPYKQKGKQSHERIEAVGAPIESGQGAVPKMK
jgi:hypothetical protein